MFFDAALPRITDLYKTLGISSRAGDKILDRLEYCWRYIECIRNRRNRKVCYPTLLGLIALTKRQTYLEELLKHYEGTQHYYKLKNYFSFLASFEDDVDKLRVLLDEASTAILKLLGFNNDNITNLGLARAALDYTIITCIRLLPLQIQELKELVQGDLEYE